MESLKTINEILDDLEALTPNASTYMRMFIDELASFEREEFKEYPELIQHSLPNLSEDQNEITFDFKKDLEDLSDEEKDQALNMLSQLASHLRDRPVTILAIEPILKSLGVELPTPKPLYDQATEKDEKPVKNVDEPIRFRMPNLLYSRAEMARFLTLCDLTEISDAGSGSHTKWVDENGATINVASWSKKSWLKNNIKIMLAAGLPVERVKHACRKLNIDFQVINK